MTSRRCFADDAIATRDEEDQAEVKVYTTEEKVNKTSMKVRSKENKSVAGLVAWLVPCLIGESVTWLIDYLSHFVLFTVV